MRENASSFLSFLSQFTFIFNIINKVVWNLDDEERFPPLHCAQKHYQHDNKTKQARAIKCINRLQYLFTWTMLVQTRYYQQLNINTMIIVIIHFEVDVSRF